jgi:hypothetical protein
VTVPLMRERNRNGQDTIAAGLRRDWSRCFSSGFENVEIPMRRPPSTIPVQPAARAGWCRRPCDPKVDREPADSMRRATAWWRIKFFGRRFLWGSQKHRPHATVPERNGRCRPPCDPWRAVGRSGESLPPHGASADAVACHWPAKKGPTRYAGPVTISICQTKNRLRMGWKRGAQSVPR